MFVPRCKCVEVRGPVGVNILLLPCESWGLNSGSQASISKDQPGKVTCEFLPITGVNLSLVSPRASGSNRGTPTPSVLSTAKLSPSFACHHSVFNPSAQHSDCLQGRWQGT